MQEFVAGLTSDPLLLVAGLASLVGLFVYWSYDGFIHENYTHIKWFRRLLLPHVTRLLKKAEKDGDFFKGIYVETDTLDSEHVFDLYLEESRMKEGALDAVGDTLIENHFRPEVLLASLGSNSSGLEEVGNFVLTAPNKNHPDSTGLGRIYDIVVMFISKYQLHVRIFYDPEKHRLRFYAHYELNPYNPFYAQKHLDAEEFDIDKGVEMFREYADELEKYGIEVVE